uniref:Uncharacterized protein n=1 Tax=Oryza brachyantha TaxID=4533 RepID=J3LRF3_ORYBR
MAELKGEQEGAVKINIDNQSAIQLSKRFHFNQECIEEGRVDVVSIGTAERAAGGYHDEGASWMSWDCPIGLSPRHNYKVQDQIRFGVNERGVRGEIPNTRSHREELKGMKHTLSGDVLTEILRRLVHPVAFARRGATSSTSDACCTWTSFPHSLVGIFINLHAMYDTKLFTHPSMIGSSDLALHALHY